MEQLKQEAQNLLVPLALALMSYTLILRPEKFILGGGVMKQEQLFPLVRDEFKRLLNGYVETFTVSLVAALTLRIKQAKQLLKAENLSVEEIVWMIGYDDPSYFATLLEYLKRK
jgi:predicted NBD/HSP70 family sugar kinase